MRGLPRTLPVAAAAAARQQLRWCSRTTASTTTTTTTTSAGTPASADAAAAAAAAAGSKTAASPNLPKKPTRPGPDFPFADQIERQKEMEKQVAGGGVSKAVKERRAARGLGLQGVATDISHKKMIKKGSVDFGAGKMLDDKAGAANDPQLSARLVEETVAESIDFSEHAQQVLTTFRGASAFDWEECFDVLLDRDTYNRAYINDWAKDDEAKARSFCAVRVVLFIMADIYFCNPVTRHLAVPQYIAASSRLEEKTLKAGWWQEAFSKVITKNQVEEVSYLKAVADTILAHDNEVGENPLRYAMRNLVNTYTRMCTYRVPATINDMMKNLDMVWGSYFVMLMDVRGLDYMKPENADWIEACSHMGKAYGLITVLESLEHASVTNCVMVSADLMNASDCSLPDFYEGKSTQGTTDLIRRLCQLLQQEMNLAAEKAKSMPRRDRQLIFFRHMCDCQGAVKLWGDLDYKLPEHPDEESYREVRWQWRRRGAVINRKLKLKYWLSM